MRECPFPGCGKHIADDKFACAPHWFSLSAEQKTVVWDSYRAYLSDNLPLEELRQIQKAVVDAVAGKAGEASGSVVCGSCHAPILWAVTASTGSRMPLDAAPNPEGNVILRDGKALVAGKADLFNIPTDETRYMSHFATCPAAKTFRKKK